MYKNFFKRVLDLIFSFIILIVMLPLFLFVALLIKLDSKGPVFFKQERVGKGFLKIHVFKFRTMANEKHEVGSKPLIGKAPGVTNFGYFLRRFKIDELPQLLSVFNGDLSLVGPRPSIREHLENMTDKEKQRYSVKPGLTGLAQVSGNIHIPWKERYKYDLKYIENITFLNDIKILVRTVLLIFVGEEKFKNKPLKIKDHS